MKKSRFTEEEIRLRAAPGGGRDAGVGREPTDGIAEAVYCIWRKKYANPGVSELRQLRGLHEVKRGAEEPENPDEAEVRGLGYRKVIHGRAKRRADIWIARVPTVLEDGLDHVLSRAGVSRCQIRNVQIRMPGFHCGERRGNTKRGSKDGVDPLRKPR